MASDPNLIAKRLREQRKQVKDETVVLNEQLALVDVIIDEYDDLIIKLDNKIQPLLPPINYQIDQVQKAYLGKSQMQIPPIYINPVARYLFLSEPNP